MTAATIKWATAPHAKAASYTQREGTPEEFLAWLDPEHPALTEPTDDPAQQKAAKLSVPMYVLGELTHTGREAQVLSRYGATLDLDGCTPEGAEVLVARVRGLQVWAVLHSTHSATEQEPRYRVVLMYSRPVTPDEHIRLTRVLMAELGRGLPAFDERCAEPGRDMFRPSHPRGGFYHWEAFDGEPLDVDEWLSRAPAEAATASAAEAVEAVRDPDRADRVVERVLTQDLPELAALPEGGRTDRGHGWYSGVFKAATRLVRAHNSGARMPFDELEAAFFEAAPAAENNYDPRDKWTSALEYVGGAGLLELERDPRSTAAQDFTAVPGQGVAEPSPNDIARRFPRLSLASLLDPARPPREWVVEGLLPAGASLSLIAPAGEGKSLFVLAMVLDVARGRANFAGLRIPRKRRVLVIDMENTEDDYAERMTALGVTLDNLHELDDMVFLNLPDLAPLDTATGAAELRSIIEYYGLDAGDLVVLDSFQRVTEGPENDSDTARAFYRHTATMLKSLGLTVVRTDNTGKDAEKGARGTSSKRDDVDVELIMTREKGEAGAFRLTPGKVRGGGIARLSMVREVDERGRLRYGTGTFTETTREATERVIQELNLLSMGQDAAWKTVQAHPEWKEHPRVTRDYLREVHKELKELP
ncbi:AAA family ATPase [Micrococcus luteus]|uniref:AAA family ATPase n=1 Tax=Micrococcus luteus TaxID=1270 RepID=UPI00147EA95D|nr:AAA family ATPase [Micrococcus luteus]NNM48551.1 AAA family ATPase [Micrococcus luteus]